MAVFTTSYFAPSGTSSNTDVYYRFDAANTGFYTQAGSSGTIWAAAGGNEMLTISSNSVGLGDWSDFGNPSTRGGGGLHVRNGTALQKWVNTSSSSDAAFIGFNAFVDYTNYNLAGIKVSTDVNRRIISQYFTLPASHTSQNTTDRKLTLQAASLLHGTTLSAGSMSDNQWYMVSNGFMTARNSVTAPAAGTAVNALRLSATVGGSTVSLGPAVQSSVGVWLVSASMGGTGAAGTWFDVAIVTAQPDGTWATGDGAATSIATGGGVTIGMSADTQYITVQQTSGSDQTVYVTAQRLL